MRASLPEPNQEFTFCEVLGKHTSKIQIIVTFFSILELVKIGYIQISQEKLFADIKITSLKSEDLVPRNNI